MARSLVTAAALGHGPADKRLEILQLVGRHGSISQAARSAGVSYKAAWQAIHTLTNLAGEPLVDSSVGGAGGGGARLTPAGERLLAAADQLQAARRGVLARVNSADSAALAGPRTSMRNHLRAVVERLESDGARDPMVRVVLALAGDGALASLITRESAELLGWRPACRCWRCARPRQCACSPWTPRRRRAVPTCCLAACCAWRAACSATR